VKEQSLKHWRFGGPGRPLVRLDQIRGPVMVSRDMIWQSVVWNGGRCWAYVHDCDPLARTKILDSLREAELARSDPHGTLKL